METKNPFSNHLGNEVYLQNLINLQNIDTTSYSELPDEHREVYSKYRQEITQTRLAPDSIKKQRKFNLLLEIAFIGSLFLVAREIAEYIVRH